MLHTNPDPRSIIQNYGSGVCSRSKRLINVGSIGSGLESGTLVGSKIFRDIQKHSSPYFPASSIRRYSELQVVQILIIREATLL
jgi:hypothetical protein